MRQVGPRVDSKCLRKTADTGDQRGANRHKKENKIKFKRRGGGRGEGGIVLLESLLTITHAIL